MGQAENLDLLRRAMRASTKGDERSFAETHTDDVAVYANGLIAGRGLDALMAYWKRWFGPFPDLKLTPSDMMVDDDRIFFDATMSGTHTGPWTLANGEVLPPTGHKFEVAVVVHFRLREGKLAEVREFINLSEIVRQLGADASMTRTES
jgi:steroid delta-isomerase-like uncharacterized protein